MIVPMTINYLPLHQNSCVGGRGVLLSSVCHAHSMQTVWQSVGQSTRQRVTTRVDSMIILLSSTPGSFVPPHPNLTSDSQISTGSGTNMYG